MTQQFAVFLPIWMLIAAAFGFLAGQFGGDYRRHRACLQQINDLHGRLQQSGVDVNPIQRALKERCGVINDIHRRLMAVSKGIEERPS